MSLLNKITVDQFQRIVSIEANSIYTTSDKKIGVIAVLDGIPIEQVKKMTIAEVNKRYAEINAASKSLSSLAAKRHAKVAGKWYQVEWFIDEISAGQLVELYSYDMTSEQGVIDNLHLILATLSRECRVWKWWPKAYDGKGHKQRAEAMLRMNMGDVWGYAAFFAAFRAFVDDYAEVFDGSADDDDNGQGVKKPNYGWVSVVYRMAGKDPLRMDQVFNMPAREFMNALLLMKAMP